MGSVCFRAHPERGGGLVVCIYMDKWHFHAPQKSRWQRENGGERGSPLLGSPLLSRPRLLDMLLLVVLVGERERERAKAAGTSSAGARIDKEHTLPFSFEALGVPFFRELSTCLCFALPKGPQAGGGATSPHVWRRNTEDRGTLRGSAGSSWLKLDYGFPLHSFIHSRVIIIGSRRAVQSFWTSPPGPLDAKISGNRLHSKRRQSNRTQGQGRGGRAQPG